MRPAKRPSFTRADAATVFDRKPSAFRAWQAKGICSIGKPGKTWLYSWLDMVKIGMGLSLNSYGIALADAFRVVEDPVVQSLLIEAIVEREPFELYLYYSFDPEDPTKGRGDPLIFGRVNDAMGFLEIKDFEVPTEAQIRVNLLPIAKKWVAKIAAYEAGEGEQE